MSIPTDVVELVRKNLKNLIRAKAGSLVVIFGPLLVVFLAGLAFDNSNVYAVKIGAYRPDVNDITTSFLDQLGEQFNVLEYNDKQECIDAIKNTDVNTCMIFSSEFTIGIPAKNEITFYVDYSRINLVWTIMQAMTEEVGERSLSASRDLTKVLLDTLEYTDQRIGDQREVIVQLTTENELILRNTRDLIAELGDLDLTFDERGFVVSNLTKSKTQIKQWMQNALSLGDKGLSKAVSFIDSADKLVKGSSAGGKVKNKLLENFQKSVADIKKLQADMTQTKKLTKESFENFDAQIKSITSEITSTKNRLKEADASRGLSLRVLQAIAGLLDKSLLNIITVQQALNDIDNRISAIEIRDPGAITQPIVTTVKPVIEEKTYLNYLFPVLIVLVIMFTALLITPTLVLLEKHSTASFRTYMTPVKDASYILANFVTAFILLFIQVIIILAIASIFFSGQIISNMPEAILLLLLINSLFILFGMIIGYIFNTEETATLAAVSVGAVFLFISDVIIPIESMPEAFSYIASFNPYVMGSSLLRRALLFDASLFNLLGDILVFIGYIIAAALLASGIYLLTRRYSMQQLTKKLAPVLARFKRK